MHLPILTRLRRGSVGETRGHGGRRRPMRSGPKLALAGAALRKAAMQWRATGPLCGIPTLAKAASSIDIVATENFYGDKRQT
jgi:hypothetical protein